MGKIKYKDGYRYQLVEPYIAYTDLRPPVHISSDYIILSTTGVLILNKGYAWDGPSGPAIHTKNFMRGSLIHDALYQLIEEGLLSIDYKLKADDELYKACREDGMSWIRAQAVRAAVGIFGLSNFEGQEVEILEAP